MAKHRFSIHLLVKQNNTSSVIDITDNSVVFFDFEDLLDCGVSRKQLDLYLFRHKEIARLKHKDKKLVQAEILGYLLENLKRSTIKASKNH